MKGDRCWENVANTLNIGLRVDKLASAMVADAEAKAGAGAAAEATTVQGNANILAAAAMPRV